MWLRMHMYTYNSFIVTDSVRTYVALSVMAVLKFLVQFLHIFESNTMLYVCNVTILHTIIIH